MNSKEKVINAVNHKQGPVPVDLGGTSITGMHCDTIAKLRSFLGLDKHPVKIIEPYQMLGEIEADLAQALHIDTIPLWSECTMTGARMDEYKQWRTPWGQEVLIPENFALTPGDGGSVYGYPQGDLSCKPCIRMPETGYFFDAIDKQEDYDEDNLKLEDNIEEFGPIDDKTLSAIIADADKLKGTDKAVISSFGGTGFGDIALVPGIGLKNPKGIRGIADWYMLLADDPDFVKKIFDVQLEYGIENLKKIHEAIGDVPDVLMVCGTDFGTQTGTFCSPETFRDLYKPYYVKVNKWIHENTNWKTFKHSCGAVEILVEEFIQSGFDVLNPVQWNAKGMDRQNLKDKYGDRITFWGGGIDTQKTLPFGTADQVYKEAQECCQIFSKNGGYVFNAIHNIQAMVPAENVAAMFRAVYDFNKNG